MKGLELDGANESQVVDVHCHFFNLAFAAEELAASALRCGFESIAHALGLDGSEGTVPASGFDMPERGAAEQPVETVCDQADDEVHDLSDDEDEGGDLHDESSADVLAWLNRLACAASRDSTENHHAEVASFRESRIGGGRIFRTTPLMMDLAFIFDDNSRRATDAGRGGRDAQSIRERRTGPVESEGRPDSDAHAAGKGRFSRQALANRVVRETKREIAGKEPQVAAHDAPFFPVEKQLRLSDLALSDAVPEAEGDIIRIQSESECESLIERAKAIAEMSPGFERHLRELGVLAFSSRGLVLPFLAVDPRRPGIFELVRLLTGEGRGPFRGIKLYPPLGCLPTHPNMLPIFDYCQKWDIPVTFHCARGGLANLRSRIWIETWLGRPYRMDFTRRGQTRSGMTKDTFFCDPRHWIPVLEQFPRLRVNFGHFGGRDLRDSDSPRLEWVETIIGLMREFPHVYADISYSANPVRLERMMMLVESNPILERRLMFGTDFVMLELDEALGGLRNYFDQFEPYMERMPCADRLMGRNAEAFLGIRPN